MLQKLYAFILYRLLGWQFEGEIPRDLPRALFVFLPHTSNWDFVIGWLFIKAENLNITIFAKDAFNFFPLKYGYRYFNVVPIKRSRVKTEQSNNFVMQASGLYEDGKALWTAMAPEGTRSQQSSLRSGYYYFAKKADIQLIVVGPDFLNKKLIILPARDVKTSFDEDANALINFSQRCRARYPENAI